MKSRISLLVVLPAVLCVYATGTSVDLRHHKATHTSGAAQDSYVDIEERGRLINDLLTNYDKRNYPSNMTVQLGLALVRFDVDLLKKNFEADVWLRQAWNDSRLAWDPKKYGGETLLRLPADQIWKPDITLYNTALSKEASSCRQTNVLVYPSGEILWVPSCQFKAYCNLGLNTNPFGTQTCGLKFGSWTFEGFSMDLQFFNNTEKADLSDFWDISDYKITGNKASRNVKRYDCCSEPYVDLNFDISFQRKH